MDTVDRVVPKGEWAFDEEVTKVFDDMLKRSIPQYDVMRTAVLEVGKRFVRNGSAVVDLGCSRGEALAPFVEQFPLAKFVGVEVSEPMADASEVRFSGYGNKVSIERIDLRHGFPKPTGGASLVLSVLTLQFVPIEHRQRVVRDAFKLLNPGGAMIVVEKVLGEGADLDRILVEIYHEMKRRNGYTAEDVIRKKTSLEGVLVPVTAKWNEDLLRRAGFAEVDCFWRWANFAAWVAVKA